uniref:Uncharacterized protein n=1 Tax=Oryza rufipogon TaxID=4529 RepID=A0A0E0PBK8_ORYRU
MVPVTFNVVASLGTMDATVLINASGSCIHGQVLPLILSSYHLPWPLRDQQRPGRGGDETRIHAALLPLLDEAPDPRFLLPVVGVAPQDMEGPISAGSSSA